MGGVGLQDFIPYARLLARTVALHEDGAEGHPQRVNHLTAEAVGLPR